LYLELLMALGATGVSPVPFLPSLAAGTYQKTLCELIAPEAKRRRETSKEATPSRIVLPAA